MLTASRSDALLRSGLLALDRPTPFRAEADAALAAFRVTRTELESQVRRGDLTVKVARERAGAAAAALRTDLSHRAAGYSPTPIGFLNRLVAASNQRRKAQDAASLEGLQRETNRLLRLSLIETQVQGRTPEFEARAFVRPVTGGVPAPTLDSLLTFHRTAGQNGDEAALEWSRRQLEAFRSRVVEETDLRRIDLACDRPDLVNPRLVSAYVEAMSGHDVAELETFVDRAIAEADANACVAAFVLARQAPDQVDSRWVRRVLSGLAEFPDVALSTLRTLESDARAGEAEAAWTHVDLAIAYAETEARLDGLEAPTADDLDRARRAGSMPMARPSLVAAGDVPGDLDEAEFS